MSTTAAVPTDPDPLPIACTFCHATPSQGCINTLTGKPLPAGFLHGVRRVDAEQAAKGRVSNATKPGDAAPPAGAEPDVWQDGAQGRYRVVHGRSRGVLGVDNVIVGATALQLADGSIDDGERIELVWVEASGDVGLTVKQARDLAAEIIDACAEAERWADR